MLLGFLLIEETHSQDLSSLRARMVSEVDALYAETRAETGLSSMSPAVRAALGKVERHRLVPASQVPLAYRNHPLPIGSGQTISQPYIVALSTDLDRKSTRLNSSHGYISYAVFCLKKKNIRKVQTTQSLLQQLHS